MPEPIALSGALSGAVNGVMLQMMPLLMYYGAFLVTVAFLKDIVLEKIIRGVATEFQWDSAKRIYYDMYVEPENEYMSRAEKRRNAWLEGTDIFDKKDNPDGYKEEYHEDYHDDEDYDDFQYEDGEDDNHKWDDYDEDYWERKKENKYFWN